VGRGGDRGGFYRWRGEGEGRARRWGRGRWPAAIKAHKSSVGVTGRGRGEVAAGVHRRILMALSGGEGKSRGEEKAPVGTAVLRPWGGWGRPKVGDGADRWARVSVREREGKER
jgi:hypothetical protein